MSAPIFSLECVKRLAVSSANITAGWPKNRTWELHASRTENHGTFVAGLEVSRHATRSHAQFVGHGAELERQHSRRVENPSKKSKKSRSGVRRFYVRRPDRTATQGSPSIERYLSGCLPLLLGRADATNRDPRQYVPGGVRLTSRVSGDSHIHRFEFTLKSRVMRLETITRHRL